MQYDSSCQLKSLFINYLSFTYDLKDVLLHTKLPIVIHTHGYDITCDFISRDAGELVYSESCLDFAREISRKALFVESSTRFFCDAWRRRRAYPANFLSLLVILT